MTAKETIDKKTKTLIVERDRTHYARSYGDSVHVRVVEPLAVDLELPASYVRDLLHALKRVTAAEDEFDHAQIAIDVPLRLHLRPLQIEQLIVKLAEIVP